MRCLALFYDRHIADGSWRRSIGRKCQCMHWNLFSMSRCNGETWRLLAYVADHNYAKILVQCGAALSMPKCVHRQLTPWEHGIADSVYKSTEFYNNNTSQLYSCKCIKYILAKSLYRTPNSFLKRRYYLIIFYSWFSQWIHVMTIKLLR